MAMAMRWRWWWRWWWIEGLCEKMKRVNLKICRVWYVVLEDSGSDQTADHLTGLPFFWLAFTRMPLPVLYKHVLCVMERGFASLYTQLHKWSLWLEKIPKYWKRNMIIIIVWVSILCVTNPHVFREYNCILKIIIFNNLSLNIY